nr:gustatory receptor 22 [Papilio dardanus]
MKTLTLPNNNESNRILSALKPIFFLERCCGIFRFRVDGELFLPAKRRMRIIGFFIYLIYSILYLTLTVGFVTQFKTARIVEVIPSLMTFFQYTVTIAMQLFVEDHDIINIFKLLENIDRSLRIAIDDNLYEDSRMETLKLLGLLCLSYLSMTVFNIFNEVEIKMEYFVSLPIYFESELEILLFYKLIGMIRKRMVVINKYFSKFTTRRLYSKTFMLDRSDTVFVIEQCPDYIGRASVDNIEILGLTETYYQIGEVCVMINRIFNLVILTTFISSFSFIIITFWSSLYYFQTNKTYRYLLKIVVWSSTQIIAVVMLSLNCEKLLQTKEKTKVLVNNVVMDYELPKVMRMQAKVFMNSLQVWPLRVFIYDMFCTDLQCIFKIISLCTTYLIVVIQVTHFL